MAEKRCCPKCFGDSGLTDRIFPGLQTAIGDCDYCFSMGVETVPPYELLVSFEALLDIYEPNEDGKILSEWLKEDWLLFDHPETRRSSDAQVLLSDIIGSGDRAREKYSPIIDSRDEAADLWDSLSIELRTGNRWFPESKLEEDRLGKWFDLLVTSQLQSEWFRARLLDSQSIPEWKDLGAPPPSLATNGRVNPQGIPCLYLASDENTAISEVRPHTGGCAWVGTFQIGDLEVIDLRNPRKTVSPFKVDEPDQLGILRDNISLLEKFGAELSKPVQPHAAGVDYIPSQYLCEFIKSQGYDGVLYLSSVSKGENLALFDPLKAAGSRKSRFQVKGVTVDIDRVS